jgi:hypothetical protein
VFLPLLGVGGFVCGQFGRFSPLSRARGFVFGCFSPL